MPTVSNAARITSKDGAVWRTCQSCGTLAALPTDIDRCAGCRPGAEQPPAPDVAVQLRPEHFDPGDLFAISVAGCRFALAVADIVQHGIGDPTEQGSNANPPAELARLRDALDQVQSAIGDVRADLAVIERRARRKAARETARVGKQGRTA